MKSVGANYIRNTMSDRQDFGFEAYPFKKLPSGKYNLKQWNPEYWARFRNMLQLTAQRNIIVQIEVWDRFDYSDHRNMNNWQRHPYNPKNNVNYTVLQSGLKTTYNKHPNKNEQPFFYTVPRLKNNTTVLQYQIAQVDKMLDIALPFDHVLFCMDNETSGSPLWAKFWADHIQQRAKKLDKVVYLTEMWDQWDPRGEHHRNTFSHPETYGFVDISQNNHNRGQRHWDNFHAVRKVLKSHPRPINTVKIYGAGGGRFGNGRDGEERFWRNIFAGAAGTRFHRPDSGLGLSSTAQAHIKSMRLLLAELDIFRCQSDATSRLLKNRESNEAFLTFVDQQQYALYFPDGGSLQLDLRKSSGSYQMRWLDIMSSQWKESQQVDGGSLIPIEAPGKGHSCCLLKLVK